MTTKPALPGMEAYIDEDEVVFSSPIGRRNSNTISATTTRDRQQQDTINSPTRATTTSKLWALGKQTLDEERVFKFDEEERSPAKQQQRVTQRETRGKKTKSRVVCSSRWDSSSETETSIEVERDDGEEHNKENEPSNIKDLQEIEQKLAKIKLEKGLESSTRLVVVVDTNCLINRKQRESILALKHYTQLLFIVPFIVLQELDKLKNGDDSKAYDVRQAAQFLNSEISRDNLWIRGQCQNELPINPCKLLRSNDDQILKCCLYYQELSQEEAPGNSPHDVLLVTLDRVLQVKAKSHNISSIDCVTLRTKLDTSWHETTRVATGIFFKDGKLCTPTSSAQQQSTRPCAVPTNTAVLASTTARTIPRNNTIKSLR